MREETRASKDYITETLALENLKLSEDPWLPKKRAEEALQKERESYERHSTMR